MYLRKNVYKMWLYIFSVLFFLQSFSADFGIGFLDFPVQDVPEHLIKGNMSKQILQLVKSFQQNSKIFINNQDVLTEMLLKLFNDGKSKLQVIADFDWTLTKSNVNGVPTMHCYDIFALLPMLNDTYHEKKNAFLKKYVKLLNESDNDEDKDLISKLWFDDHERLIVGLNFSQEDLREAVDKADAPLRDGCVAFIEALAEHCIPLTVLSSGIGDVIQLHLEQQGLHLNNTVANFLLFNDTIVQGFKEPFVSPYNKNNVSLPVNGERPNIILLGDSLEDHQMGDSIPDRETVLKIGFCPDTTKLPKYQEYFDIVLVDDQTMNTVESIMSLFYVNNENEEL